MDTQEAFVQSLSDDAVSIDGIDYLPINKPNHYKDYELIYYINDVTIDNEEVLVEYGAAGTVTGTYEYGLQRLSVEHVNEAKEYYLYNGTGNVTQTTAENGSMFLRYTYDAFGNVTSINAPMTVDIDDLNRYTYNGEDYDYNTGLQYLRARYYSTGTGNFISQDTYLGDLLNPLSQNRYTYTHNSPVMFDDPSGHFLLTAFLIGAGIGALVNTVVTTYDAATDGGTKDFSFSNLDGDDGRRIVRNATIGGLVGGTAGTVGAVVGTALTGAFGATALGATGGVTLTLGQSIGVGVASSVSAGMAGRASNALWNNVLCPDEAPQNALAAAFNPMAILTDIAFGAIGGALTHYVTGGYYSDPFKNGIGNKTYLDDVVEQADDARNATNCGRFDELLNALDDVDDGIGSRAGNGNVVNPRPPRIPNTTAQNADDFADDVFSAVDDSVEGGIVAKGTLIGKLDDLTSAERKMIDDLLNTGNNVEIIPRSDIPGNKTPDFLVNGVKTELKTLTGTSLNTPVTRIQDGFKQGAEVVIIDGRNTGMTLDDANTVIERALGIYGGELSGKVEIWTTEGVLRR